MPTTDLLLTLSREIIAVFGPLRRLGQQPEELARVLEAFGWPPPPGTDVAPVGRVLDVTPLLDSAEALAVEIADDSSFDVGLVTELTQTAARLVETVRTIGGAAGGGLPAPYDSAAFWGSFPGELFEYLLLVRVDQRQPLLSAILQLVGVIREEEIAAAGGRGAFVRRRLVWEQLGRLFSDPATAFKETYGWGAPGAFRHGALLRSVQKLLGNLHRVGLSAPTAESLDEYYAPGNVARNTLLEVSGPLVESFDFASGDLVSFGGYVLPIPATGDLGGTPEGIAFGTRFEGAVSASLPAGPFEITLTGGVDTTAGPRVEIRPSGVRVAVSAGVTALDAGMRVSLAREKPMRLLGGEDSHRVELARIAGGTRIRGPVGDIEFLLDLALDDLTFVIQMGEGDGFLTTVLGTDPHTITASLGVSYSSKHGLTFNGVVTLEFTIGLHLDVGPIHFEMLRLTVRAGAGVPLEIGVGVVGRAALGPLVASVDGIGVKAIFEPRALDAPPGNLGRLDLGLGFLPPRGVGLSVDAGPVKGGGYVFFDPDHGEYAGALELVFSDFLSLTAIGLITTRMPDGSTGFSLLIIITAEFGAGIQLGYGFTLIGVGGLLGLNRAMELQPLVEGVRTGAVNSVLFPRDVVANAPRILSDLKAIFPPQNGIFVVGPMAKLGWGTPTLISLALGIIVEIPGNVVILGVLRIALPREELPLVVLQVNFVGVIEFDKKRLYLFAGLFDSRVLFFTLDGEMGVLAAFGEDANFVLSVGGFHPRFSPPPLPFPVPKRLALTILDESWGRVRAEAYFAVTTNTAQMGARADAFFGLDAFSVEGHLGFDALLQFSPFHLVVEIRSKFSVKVFGVGVWGVRIRMQLDGPSPWHAQGEGSISLLFFDIDVGFDFTWGEERDTTLPPIEVMPLVAAELGNGANWQARLPAGNRLLVALRRLPTEEAKLVLHPLGTLRVSQRAVPLDLTLDKVGNQVPSDVNRVSLRVAGGALAKRADVDESFAPAQFRNYGDAAKLAKPAYEKQHGGVELAPQGPPLSSGPMVKRVVRYEVVTIDTAYRRVRARFIALAAGLFAHLVKGASVARSPLSKHHRTTVVPFADAVGVPGDRYTVAFVDNNRAYRADSRSFTSEASAQDYLASEVRRDRSLGDALHVIPSYEEAA